MKPTEEKSRQKTPKKGSVKRIDPSKQVPASFQSRAVALLIDLLVPAVGLLFIWGVFTMLAGPEALQQWVGAHQGVVQGVVVFILVSYFGLRDVPSIGLGKRKMNIQAVDAETGAPVSKMNSVLRNGFLIALVWLNNPEHQQGFMIAQVIWLFFAYLVPYQLKRRTGGDMMANTKVIKL